MAFATDSDLFRAVEEGRINKVVELIEKNGTSPTVRNKVSQKDYIVGNRVYYSIANQYSYCSRHIH